MRATLSAVVALAALARAQDLSSSSSSVDAAAVAATTTTDAATVDTAVASTTTDTAAAAASSSASAAVSSSQFWHERYHGLLSMAAYADDPTTVCAQTFSQSALASSFPDSTEAPWTYIQGWGPTASGTSGFSVIIPEMDKVVMVFRGMFGWESTFNMSSVNIGTLLNLGENCANCTAHAGAVQAYLEAKEATNDWELVKYYVNITGHQWSLTGHGFGGMIEQVAALDLGWRGLSHWSHNHGSARVMNPAAASLYNSLYGGEAGQRTVANADSGPTLIPESDEYTHTLQGFHIVGNGTSNSTYGYDYYVCNDATDPECLGGNNSEDGYAYYTPIGKCGQPYYGTNLTVEDEYISTASAAFFATATSTFIPSSVATPSSSSATGEVHSTNAAGAVVADAAPSASVSSSSQGGSNGAAGLAVSAALALVAGVAAIVVA
ncbi:hypothetical protein JCM8097_006129 [Rhodosporidiobolus ruineniae]